MDQINKYNKINKLLVGLFIAISFLGQIVRGTASDFTTLVAMSIGSLITPLLASIVIVYFPLWLLRSKFSDGLRKLIFRIGLVVISLFILLGSIVE